ncbi:hypothetical protein ACQ4M3_40315 [Leptolyngbya sp. AN03gr2]|uniref:hypothetical protein n=1 Tax=unclassified Leptolyngbya TaxID=2650499 RepID=UPI003D31151A
MTKQQWRSISLTLGAILFGLVVWVGSTPLSSQLLAQVTSMSQCRGLSPGSSEFQTVQSLIERYEIGRGIACKNGRWRGSEHPEVRADVAEWLATGLDRLNELIAAATADLAKKNEIAELNQQYKQTLAQVEALEQQLRPR